MSTGEFEASRVIIERVFARAFSFLVVLPDNKNILFQVLIPKHNNCFIKLVILFLCVVLQVLRKKVLVISYIH